MVDIVRPPRPPQRPPQTPPAPVNPTTPPPQPEQPVSQPEPIVEPLAQPPVKKRQKWPWIVLGAVLAVLLTLGGAWLWYQSQLAPVNPGDESRVEVTVQPGTSPDGIAAQLYDQGLIKSEWAFDVYTRFSGTQNVLQAGTYRLSPSESTPKIVAHLTQGVVDTFAITFLPGGTLAEHREVFIEAGYEASEVDAALDAEYDRPLFATKPADADLEGYIYGETYYASSTASVADILAQTFDEYERVVEENDLVSSFETRGLTLYEGITLASIIQREAIGGDEPQIAQVFLLRLSIDMQLGSDVTYQYIADKTGQPRDVNLDSPYNTRRYTGLPPGPIASPGLNSLLAVANPAEGDYLYFLSGDDDVTYFARTLEEHEANIRNHCQEKCQIL